MSAALITLGALYALWVFFLAVMNLARADQAGTLPRTSFILGVPLLTVAYVLDVAINQTLGTVLLLDMPREWTLSERLERLKSGADWRGIAANAVLRCILAPFDPTGGHNAK